MIFFAMTILSSATLLFLIEPMIARFILPWFGGGPSIWSTCMLFFQLFLLGGYAYAHFIGTRLSPRRQGMVHIGFLLLSLCFLPVTPGEGWKPLTTPLHPALNIIGLLGATIGLPFGLLSSSSPLHMHWFSRNFPGRAPYRLYALSNIGSIVGLMLYPFVLEPLLTLRAQTLLWSGAYILFVLSSGLCALRLIRQEPDLAPAAEPAIPSQSQPHAGLGVWNPIFWILLSAIGSVMLLATTNQMCQEVAVFPFLWIIPLTLYLVSFILCFESERWYNRYVWGVALLLSAGGILWLLNGNQVVHVLIQIGILAFTLFACCMTCHGELVRLKPPAEHLTAFYLMVSVGGALGGIFVNFAAPHLFSGLWEFHIGLFLAFLLFGLLVAISQKMFKQGWLITIPVAAILGAVAYLAIRHDLINGSQIGPQSLKTPAGILSSILLVIVLAGAGFWMYKPWRIPQNIAFRAVWLVCLVILGVYLRRNIHEHNAKMLTISRNFYGVLSVSDAETETGETLRSLWHGPIEHGNQVLSGERRRTPTTYYSPSSGIYLAVKSHPLRTPEVAGAAMPASGLNIGVVGLGSGTSACLAGPRDHLAFYEINPEIVRIAEDYFFYLKDCRDQMVDRKNLRIELGDARIVLERELAAKGKGGDQFDVLALDAFNGDAIPVHLLTRESFAMYWRHLKPDGILAINISNLHLDLAPVVHGLANEIGKQVIQVSNEENSDQGAYATDWALVTSNKRFLDDPIVRSMNNTDREAKPPIVWTDQYSNIVRVLNAFELPDSWKKSTAADDAADNTDE